MKTLENRSLASRSTGWRALTLAAASALVVGTGYFLLVGCDTPQAQAPAPAQRQESPHESRRIYGGGVPLQLVNDTNRHVCHVQMNPSSWRYWGDNWLNDDTEIQPNSHFTFFIQGSASWDVRVTDCDGTEISSRRGLAVSGPLRLHVSNLLGAQPGGFAGGGMGQ